MKFLKYKGFTTHVKFLESIMFSGNEIFFRFDPDLLKTEEHHFYLNSDFLPEHPNYDFIHSIYFEFIEFLQNKETVYDLDRRLRVHELCVKEAIKKQS